MWTEGIDIFETRLLKLGSRVYFGCGSIGRIDGVFREMKLAGVNRLLLLTGRNSFRKCGCKEILKDAFIRNNILYSHYDNITPNPSGEEADEAAAFGRQEKVQGVLAVGGGSVIDCGKIVASLLAAPGKADAASLLLGKIQINCSLPLAAINLTHGTGSEVNSLASLTIGGKLLPHLSSPQFYPDWAIDDPMLSCSLSREEGKFATMGALNSSIESATAKKSSVLSIMLAREAVELIVKYLPILDKNSKDLTAKYFLMYASLLAGAAYDNACSGEPHTTFQHPVRQLKPELRYGESATAILPSYIKGIYSRKGKTLARILHPISPGLTGNAEEASGAAIAIENWLTASGMPRTLQDIGFLREDIDALVEATFQSNTPSVLLTITPTEGSKGAVRALFDDAMTGQQQNCGDREPDA